ncbi:helix-turn-helix domain-containing protein [Microbacterium ulmi]|uniref:Helix-turn-helix transcriptional regulator n=1 Tax=Microbacterium ulmi TaxID=179095 RepID=A0A7Y2LYA7_9MICO|nr:XRE family transcriptional regulator [Microbacterium ulmi]NII68488.1 transcriptional regulator with XRE-family HTH domain [Microbacterium ulmi]NNH02990.1 helix-turn-helix transcriptional regulator [Microbacterium ulmi]
MPDLDTPWNTVGVRVRSARVAAGMTVRELSRRIGVSASHVSQVERGIGAFSVPALYAVARELGVSMNELLDPPNPHASVAVGVSSGGDLAVAGIIQRAADHPTIKLSSGPRWSRLTAAGEVDAEFLEVVYSPGTTAPSEDIRHEGREYGIVISGRMNVMVDGAVAVLEPGDSIVFDSSLPHRFWNESDVDVRAIWFVRDRNPGDAVPHG